MITGLLRMLFLWLCTSLLAWLGWSAGVQLVGWQELEFSAAAMGVLLIWLAVFGYSMLGVERG